MKKRILKRLRRSERGFTLMEMLVAVAILGSVSSAMTGVIFGIFSTTDDNDGRVAAVTDIEIAAHQISEDGMSAQYYTISPDGTSLTLISSKSFTIHQEATYSLSGTDVQRTCDATDTKGTVDAADDVTTTTTRVVARNIEGLQFTHLDTRALIATITSTGGGTRIEETRDYQIELRLSQ